MLVPSSDELDGDGGGGEVLLVGSWPADILSGRCVELGIALCKELSEIYTEISL